MRLFVRPLLLCSILAITAASTTYAQTTADSLRRAIEARRTDAPIRVDGVLDDAAWQRAGAGAFRQFDPKSGMPATHPTEVWIAYDDQALYVAARLTDADPTRIARN